MKKLTYTKPLTVTNKKNLDAFGEELSKYFGKPMYSVYRKFGRVKAERAFNEMQKTGDTELKHFLQLLHHG